MQASEIGTSLGCIQRIRNKFSHLGAHTEGDLPFQAYPKVISILISSVSLGFTEDKLFQPWKMPQAKEYAKHLTSYWEKGNEAKEIQIIVINIQFILFQRQIGIHIEVNACGRIIKCYRRGVFNPDLGRSGKFPGRTNVLGETWEVKKRWLRKGEWGGKLVCVVSEQSKKAYLKQWNKFSGSVDHKMK